MKIMLEVVHDTPDVSLAVEDACGDSQGVRVVLGHEFFDRGVLRGVDRAQDVAVHGRVVGECGGVDLAGDLQLAGVSVEVSDLVGHGQVEAGGEVADEIGVFDPVRLASHMSGDLASQDVTPVHGNAVFVPVFVQVWRESEDGIGGGLADLYGDVDVLDKITDLLDAAPSSVDLAFQLVECVRDVAAQIKKHAGDISSSFYSLQAAIQVGSQGGSDRSHFHGGTSLIQADQHVSTSNVEDPTAIKEEGVR